MDRRVADGEWTKEVRDRAALRVARQLGQPGRRPDLVIAYRRVRQRQRAPAIDPAAAREREGAFTAWAREPGGHCRARRDAVARDDAVRDRDRRAAAEVGVGRDLDPTAGREHALLA